MDINWISFIFGMVFGLFLIPVWRIANKMCNEIISKIEHHKIK